jgi:hypothetical protein
MVRKRFEVKEGRVGGKVILLETKVVERRVTSELDLTHTNRAFLGEYEGE